MEETYKQLFLHTLIYTRDWITEETWEEINRRKITKQKINNADEKIRPTLMAEYSEINKRVKRYSRHHDEHGQTNCSYSAISGRHK